MKSNKLICLNKKLFYFGCIILLLICYLIIDKLYLYLNKDSISVCNCPDIKIQDNNKVKEKIIMVGDNESPPQYKKGPEREYNGGRGLPINIRTRGEPNEYQNIGLIKKISDMDDVKPLYGRRTYRGSNMWNYYTVLNDHIQVKLPIMRTNNCLDERGCSEIQSGEEITVNNETYKVELYPYSDFRYIPY